MHESVTETFMTYPTAADLTHAARLLQDGQLVAFPTETVYGLGANALDDAAVARIYEAKNRPQFNPLIVHVPSAAAAARYAVFDRRAHTLAAAFWPGPLSLVLPRRAEGGLSLLVSAGLDSVAVRVPDHPLALALLTAAGVPVAAPSANPSGRVSPTTAAHVAEGLGDRVSLILDGGPCTVGVESTVVDLTGPHAVLLRPGGVSVEDLERVLNEPLDRPQAAGPIASPGMLASHYAPALPVRLNATHVTSNEALLAFGAPLTGAKITLNLSPAGNLTEAAANLFAHLRALDAAGGAVGATAIAVMPIPDTGLGLAINDRLTRAAAPR
jgi:L-threonylcarbamoyladenylate synthase